MNYYYIIACIQQTTEMKKKSYMQQTILRIYMQVDWRDIIVYLHSGRVQHLSDRNELYDPLHFVLLFPRGEPGWHPEIPHVDPHTRALRPGFAPKFDATAAANMVETEAKEGGSCSTANIEESKVKRVSAYVPIPSYY